MCASAGDVTSFTKISLETCKRQRDKRHMRQGQNNRRSRGRSNNRRSNVPNRNQTFDSNGPDTRIRGNASQVLEKYQALARDAMSSGDPIMAENYLQHAEHYQRVINQMNEAVAQAQLQAEQAREQRAALNQQQNGRAQPMPENGAEPRPEGNGAAFRRRTPTPESNRPPVSATIRARKVSPKRRKRNPLKRRHLPLRLQPSRSRRRNPAGAGVGRAGPRPKRKSRLQRLPLPTDLSARRSVRLFGGNSNRVLTASPIGKLLASA